MKMITGNLKRVGFSSFCPAGNKGNPHTTFIAGSLFPAKGSGAEIPISVTQRSVGSIVADEKDQGVFGHTFICNVIHKITK